MGKSWKEKPGKYRHNKDFQKKQKQKNGHSHTPPTQFEPPDDWSYSFIEGQEKQNT